MRAAKSLQTATVLPAEPAVEKPVKVSTPNKSHDDPAGK